MISAKPEILQFYTFANNEGPHDQLVIKAPRNLKEDVSNKFPYLFLEKKVNKTKFESAYDTKPQIAVGGMKRTITKNENKTIHRKRVANR